MNRAIYVVRSEPGPTKVRVSDYPKEAHRAYYEAAKRRSGRFARAA
jgi:hypothetical protein